VVTFSALVKFTQHSATHGNFHDNFSTVCSCSCCFASVGFSGQCFELSTQNRDFSAGLSAELVDSLALSMTRPTTKKNNSAMATLAATGPAIPESIGLKMGRNQTPRALIVSAWEPEQQWLRQEWANQSQSVQTQLDLDFLLLGIGPLKAAAQLTRWLTEAHLRGESVHEVIFVGTAGSYDLKKFGIGQVVATDSVWFSEGGAATGQSFFPAQVSQQAIHYRGHLRPHYSATPQACTVCVPSVTSQAALAAELFKLGDLENLETAGVAQACEVFGVPWWALLGVSNGVGPRGHEEWRMHHNSVSQAAQKKLFEILVG
jgi:nucleoside phosphorylase